MILYYRFLVHFHHLPYIQVCSIATGSCWLAQDSFFPSHHILTFLQMSNMVAFSQSYQVVFRLFFVLLDHNFFEPWVSILSYIFHYPSFAQTIWQESSVVEPFLYLFKELEINQSFKKHDCSISIYPWIFLLEPYFYYHFWPFACCDPNSSFNFNFFKSPSFHELLYPQEDLPLNSLKFFVLITYFCQNH